MPLSDNSTVGLGRGSGNDSHFSVPCNMNMKRRDDAQDAEQSSGPGGEDVDHADGSLQ